MSNTQRHESAKKWAAKKGADEASRKVAKKAAVKIDTYRKIEEDVFNLDQETTLAQLRALLDGEKMNFHQMGALLYRIKENGWIGKQRNFKLFVMADLKMDWDRALRILGLFEVILEQGLTEDDMKGIGWSAALALAPALKSPEVEHSVKLELLKKARTKTVEILKGNVSIALKRKLTRNQATAVINNTLSKSSLKQVEDLLRMLIESHLRRLKGLPEVDQCGVVVSVLMNAYPDLSFLFQVSDGKGSEHTIASCGKEVDAAGEPLTLVEYATKVREEFKKETAEFEKNEAA